MRVIPQQLKRVIRSICACAGFLQVILAYAALGSEAAFALDPKKAITQYVHNAWTTEDGLPQNSILSIAQTHDGYLWVGTWGGLARFDGVRFTVFDRGNTPALKNNYIYALYEDSEGSLWIGTGGGGLTWFRDGKFITYTTHDGLSNDDLRSICGDRAGNLWIGTLGGGLSRFRDGKFTNFTTKEGLSSNWVYSVYEGREGSIWVGTTAGLNRFKDGKFITYTTKDGSSSNSVWVISEDREGGLWVSISGGLYRFRDGEFTRYTAKEGLSHRPVYSIYNDREGNLWIGTEGGGLNRFQDGRFTSFTTSDGLSHDTVSSIYEDREGNLWIGTYGGLDRLKDGKFTTFTTKEGLSHDWTRCVYEDREGSLWIGTHDGLDRLNNGKFTHYTRKNGLYDIVVALYGDRQGNLWCSTVWSYTEKDSMLSRFEDGIFTNYGAKAHGSPEQGSSIYEDRQGNLWIGTNSSGLKLLRDGKFTIYSAKDGLPPGKITSINDDQQGNLWIGTENGLNKFRDRKFTTYTLENGPFHITSIYEERGGSLWITTRGQGLVRFKDGELTTFTTREGLFDNVLTTVLEDGKGNFWLGSFRGIFRVSKDELGDVAQGKIRTVTSIVYGKADGMRNVECNSDQPSGWKSKDGRLWFPTVKGLVVIDPDHMRLNTLAPPVYIEQVFVGKTPVDPQQKVEVRTGQGDLEIHYTGLSFVAPEKVRFQYKLEGYDKVWVDVGTRRVAYYTNISPGSYTFRVKASNNDGVWSIQDASIQITVIPPFWRRWWFVMIVLTVAIATPLLIYSRYSKRRLRQVEKEKAAQEAFSRKLIESQEAERKRIAGELHDDLGHNLLMIRNWAQVRLSKTQADEGVRKTLTDISETALQSVEEVRRIAHHLRPHLIDDLGLTQAINAMLNKVADSSGIRFGCEVEPIDNLFSEEDEINVYRIVQECLNNIVKHSNATEARVTITKSLRAVVIEIEDNGQGFDAQANGATGLGLKGVTERARILGGTHRIDSVPGKGTKITTKLNLQGDRDEQ